MNAPGTPTPHPSLPWLAALLVLAAATAPFLGALDTPLLNDDRLAVIQNPNVQGNVDLGRIFTTNSWGSVEYYRHTPNYRPLSVVTLAITRSVTGLAPLPFKVTNLALHALASLLLLGLLLRLAVRPLGATLAATAFAAHPVHAEAVLFAVNREEILVSVFLLLLLGLAVSRSGLVSKGARRPWTPGALAGVGALAALALLSKENGATAVVLAPLILLAWPGQPSRLRAVLAPAAVLLGVFAAYLALRLAGLGMLLASFTSFQDNPLVLADLPGRLSGALALVAEAGLLLAAPLRLSIDYSWNVLGLPAPGFPAASWAGLAVVALAVAGFAWTLRRRPVIALGLLILGVTYGFVSNVVFLNSIVFGERLLYVPSLGAAIALAGVVDALPAPSPSAGRRIRLAFATLLVAWVAFLGARTALRGQDYRSSLALNASSLAARPGSSRLHVNLAIDLLRMGRIAEAEGLLRQALAIDPEDAEAHNSLGRILADGGRPAEAARLLRRAIDLRPGFPEALGNLCLLLRSRGDDEAALEWCRKAVDRGAPVREALQELECEGRCTWTGGERLLEDPPGG